MSTTRRDRRPVRAGAGVPALAVLLLLAACGSGEGDAGASPGATETGGNVSSSPDPSTTPAPQQPTPPASTGTGGGTGPTDLQIVLDDGSGTTRTWHLTCDPAGGDHPDPAAACKALAENGEKALPPVPKDMMCTQVYGGPEKATITGTWRGTQVLATLTKTNGCEISRWQALSGLLPKTGGANS
jgi:hypothetical protein